MVPCLINLKLHLKRSDLDLTPFCLSETATKIREQPEPLLAPSDPSESVKQYTSNGRVTAILNLDGDAACLDYAPSNVPSHGPPNTPDPR